jgi:benzil reductase ((S)-benzoin forming)
MSTHLFIVTGHSRGLGAALADQLLARGHALLCLARHANAELADKARQQAVPCEQWTVDLAEPVTAAARLQAWLQGFDTQGLRGATLINNAGMLSRVGPVDECADEDLSRALRVDLEAPMLLTAAFLRATRGWSARRRVLNISSGLGRRAMAGSASYCAAKAGMDHFSRAVALDEAQLKHGARIVSLAPGVIDTDMQAELRNATAAGFPEQAAFFRLKVEGQLSPAHDAAARVLAYLNRSDFGDDPVADVRSA